MKKVFTIIIVMALSLALGGIAFADQQNPNDGLIKPAPGPNLPCKAPGKPTLLEPFDGQTGLPTSVLFDWGDVPGATSYCVYIAKKTTIGPLECGKQTCNKTTESRWVNNPPFIPGTPVTRWWCVQAINSCGKGPLSSVWKFTAQ